MKGAWTSRRTIKLILITYLTDTSVPREPVELAAAFVVPSLPVDVRHNSKIDRSRLADWADSVLAGDGLSTP